MMVGRVLERDGGPHQEILAHLASDKLEAERQAVVRYAARQRDGRIAARVERARVALQRVPEVRVLAASRHGRVGRRREGLGGNDEQIDLAKQRGNAAAKVVPAQNDLLVVEPRELTAPVEELRESRAVFVAPQRERRLVSDRRLDRAELAPVGEDRTDVRKSHFADAVGKRGNHLERLLQRRPYGLLDALAVPGRIDPDGETREASLDAR